VNRLLADFKLSKVKRKHDMTISTMTDDIDDDIDDRINRYNAAQSDPNIRMLRDVMTATLEAAEAHLAEVMLAIDHPERHPEKRYPAWYPRHSERITKAKLIAEALLHEVSWLDDPYISIYEDPGSSIAPECRREDAARIVSKQCGDAGTHPELVDAFRTG
jgi:hypothetical protein